MHAACHGRRRLGICQFSCRADIGAQDAEEVVVQRLRDARMMENVRFRSGGPGWVWQTLPCRRISLGAFSWSVRTEERMQRVGVRGRINESACGRIEWGAADGTRGRSSGQQQQ